MKKKNGLKKFRTVVMIGVFMLLAACSQTDAPVGVLDDAKLTPYLGAEYLVLGQDMGRRYQNARVLLDDENQEDLAVKVNGTKIPFTDVGYPGYHGRLPAVLNAGDTLHLEVLTPKGLIAAHDVVPEAPTMTEPIAGTILDVAKPIEVHWTSESEPDRFMVWASWSCGERCGTGTRFDAEASARSFIIPANELPADTTITMGVFAYNDGSETFTGPAKEGSKMSIRAEDHANQAFETVSSATPACADPAIFADANLEAAIRENLSTSGSISQAQLHTVRYLSAESRGITSLKGLECAVNLEALNASDNAIDDLSPLAALTKMKRLSLNTNRISDLSPLSALTDIYELRLSVNPISDISALAPLTKMGLLTLAGANVSDISVLEHFPKLKTFYGAYNNFTSLASLRGANELVSLRIRHNNVEDLEPLYDLPKLRVIDLASNNVHDVNPLGSLDALEHLFLMNNPVDNATTVGLSGARNLKYLNMGATGLSDINFVHNMTNIEELIVYSNNISDLSPAAPLYKLTMLHVQLNQIEDISVIENFPKLEYFYALSNQIHDISVLNGLALKRVTLGANFITTLTPFTTMPSLTSLTVQRNCLELVGDDQADIESLIPQLDRFLYEPQRRASDC